MSPSRSACWKRFLQVGLMRSPTTVMPSTVTASTGVHSTEGIHAQYAAAGSRIVNANTFGASAHKLAGSAYKLEQIITAGI